MLRPWQLRFRIEDRAEKTLFSKLAHLITTEILSGRLGKGVMLPGSRSLAKELEINRKTVQTVYEDLEAQGWLVSKPRKGTFVSDVFPDAERSIQPIQPRDIVQQNTHLTINPPAAKFAIANDGVPDTRLIPYELFSRAYRQALIKVTQNQYMGYGDPQGTLEFRLALQQMLSMERFMSVSIANIAVVRGSQMGIFLASRALPKKQGVIVVEELCYPPALKAFNSNGYEVIRVKLDDHGLVTDHLEQILKNHAVAAVYTTPHHQYPTTVSMSMSRRLKLLELSNIWDFYIIEDDYDHEFHYDSRPMPPLASLPQSEQVIHIGSLSKVFAPGIRLGYVVATDSMIQNMVDDILLIDRQGNTITEIALANLMHSGEIKRHIRKMKKIYQLRRNHAAAEFLRVFGQQISLNIPAGGMAIWIRFCQAFNLEESLKLRTLNLEIEANFSEKGNFSQHIRFGFGALSEHEITASVENLHRVLNF